jgi:anti-sigma factor RsiW
MTNQDQMKLQAFIDGELSVREATEMRELLAADAEASALAAELRNTVSAISGNEMERELPESREFFWSKIEREIERQAEQPARSVPSESWLAWLRHYVLPVGGLAIITCLLGIVAIRNHGPKNPFGQMDLASEDMGSYTYRDHENKMTMVWLYDRESANASTVTDVSDSPTVMPE